MLLMQFSLANNYHHLSSTQHNSSASCYQHSTGTPISTSSYQARVERDEATQQECIDSKREQHDDVKTGVEEGNLVAHAGRRSGPGRGSGHQQGRRIAFSVRSPP